MSEFARSFAVVIGIDDYQNGINSLQTATNDAREIARILQQEHKYDQVWLLLDDKATRAALEQLLDQILVENIQADDRLLFYFAGHGVALNGDDGPEGHLIPQDAKAGDAGSYLPMSQLQEALGKLPCRHFLGILDCCFAGAFRWSSTRDVGLEPDEVLHKERYDRFIQDPAWQAITSAAYDQKAVDSLTINTQRGQTQTGKHSPFAAALIEALAGKADLYPPAEPGKPGGDGVITATELYLYLRDRVEPPTEELRHRQTPGIWPLKKHDKGEYIFLTPGHVLNLPPAPPLDEKRNPYRGLQSFEAEQSDLFFGRSVLTAKLGEFVSQQPLTVVLGASGSGKSSLVKAGLIPDLNQQDEKGTQPQWQILAPMRPGESPFKALSNTLTQETVPGFSVPEAGSALEVGMLTQYMAAWSQQHPGLKLLLAIDQFEELITLCRDEKECEQFLKGLAQAVTAYPEQLRLVLTLRSDFEPQFQDTVLKEHWSTAQFRVPPMTRSELREAIEEPASKRVMYFQSDDPKKPLIDQLIDEVAEMPGALPLLSFALSQLYLKYLGRQEAARQQGLPPIDRAITEEADYKALGSVQQSITKRADEIYDDLRQRKVSKAVLEKVRQTFRESSDVDEKSVERQIQQVCDEGVSDRVIRNVMLRMVSTTGIARSRRPVQCSELTYPVPDCIQVAIVLETFEQERLLTSDEDAKGNAYIEPAHDALILNWSKINLWLNERQDMVKPKPQFALLPTLKAILNLTTPASQKNPDVASDLSSKPASLQSEDLLKVNLELQRELTISANKWERARKYESEVKSQTPKNGGEQPKNAVDWLWDDDPRLPIIERVYRSTDTWLNKIEAEFVQQSVLQKRRNISRLWRAIGATMLIISAAAVIALLQWINAQKQLVSTISALANNSQELFEANQEFEALLAGLNAGTQEKRLAFGKNPDLQMRIKDTLQNAVLWIQEQNRLEGHKAGVFSVSFSRNGQLLASASDDATVKLWNVATGKIISTLTGHHDAVTFVSFSPDGQLLASASKDHTVKLWDIATGKIIFTFSGYEADFTGNNGIGFSTDGRLLAFASKGNTIQLRDVVTHQQIATLIGHKDKVNSVSFSPDGKLLASGSSDKTIKLWDVAIRKEISTNMRHDAWIFGVSFSPDGRLLASGGQNSDGKNSIVKLWDVATHKEKANLTGFADRVTNLSFSPDGQQLVAGGYSNNAKVWDITTSREIFTLYGHRAYVYGVSFSPDGRWLASASSDRTIKLWSVAPRNESNTLIGHTLQVTSLSFSPDGKLLASASGDQTVKLWDVATDKEIKTKMKHDNWIGSVSFSPDGKLLASAAFDKMIKLWDFAAGKEKININARSEVNSISFSPDGRLLASASWDGTVKLWDVATGKEIKTNMRHNTWAKSISFSPNGRLLASGSSDKTVKLWDVATRKEIKTFNQGAEVTSISFSPDGRLLVSGSSDKVKLWDIETDKEIKTFNQGAEITSISFSPDGRLLASTSKDYKIKLWDVATGKEINMFNARTEITSISFSPNGRLLASGVGSGTVILWNLEALSKLTLEDLIGKSCDWMHGYLETNPNVSDSDRHLCDR